MPLTYLRDKSMASVLFMELLFYLSCSYQGQGTPVTWLWHNGAIPLALACLPIGTNKISVFLDYNNSNPSSNLLYSSIASSISLITIYSSAVCERCERPGPILTEGKGISA